MGLEMVDRVRRYQGQCRALPPLGHQGYRFRSYKKDPPLHSDYIPSHKTTAFIINIAFFFPAGHAVLTIGAVFVRLWHRHKFPGRPEGPSKWHGVGTLSALSVVF